MPLFGDTCQCRDEGLYAVHVQTWFNMSISLNLNVRLRFEYIWERSVPFDLSP